jgi:hypothetical protein
MPTFRGFFLQIEFTVNLGVAFQTIVFDTIRTGFNRRSAGRVAFVLCKEIIACGSAVCDGHYLIVITVYLKYGDRPLTG